MVVWFVSSGSEGNDQLIIGVVDVPSAAAVVIVAGGRLLFLRKAGTTQASVECRFGESDKLSIAVPRVLHAPSCQRTDLGSQLQ